MKRPCQRPGAVVLRDRLLGAVRALGLLACAVGCSSVPRGAPLREVAAEVNALPVLAEQDVVRPGDTLSVRFSVAPEQWNQDSVAVQADGRATFLALDTLLVTGRTLAQVDEELTRGYAQHVPNPDLSVAFVSRGPATVVVLGEVRTPGQYEVAEVATLFDALALAGGPVRDTAQLDRMLFLRWDPEREVMRHWRIDARVDEWSEAPSLRLRAGDVVYLPALPVVHVNDWIDRYLRRNIPLPTLFAPVN